MVKRPLSSRWLAVVLLCAFGALSGWIWRQELEWRGGWAGLTWIGYFHWAVPVGGALFVGWAALFADMRRRLLFAAVLALLSVPVYWFVDWILCSVFASGPTVFAGALMSGGGDFDRAAWILTMRSYMVMALPLFWPLIPVALALVAWIFGLRPRWTMVVLAAVLFLMAWPLAIFARMQFEDIGGHDPIHAVKSGFIAPFLFVALGIPLLWRKPDRSPVLPSA